MTVFGDMMLLAIAAPSVVLLLGVVVAFRGPKYNRGFIIGAALLVAIILFVALTCREE